MDLNQKKFPLFNTHLDLAHQYWHRLVNPGDIAIDATCGNGHDTVFLAKCILTATTGRLVGYDVQSEAIRITQERLAECLSPEQYARVELHCKSHVSLDDNLSENSVALIVYNLGYLPGGDKKLVSQTATTMQSLKRALTLVKPGGALSITCYPGHAEGALEEEALLDFCAQLPAKSWSCCHHRWINRRQAPSLLMIQKNWLN